MGAQGVVHSRSQPGENLRNQRLTGCTCSVLAELFLVWTPFERSRSLAVGGAPSAVSRVAARDALASNHHDLVVAGIALHDRALLEDHLAEPEAAFHLEVLR